MKIKSKHVEHANHSRLQYKSKERESQEEDEDVVSPWDQPESAIRDDQEDEDEVI